MIGLGSPPEDCFGMRFEAIGNSNGFFTKHSQEWLGGLTPQGGVWLTRSQFSHRRPAIPTRSYHLFRNSVIADWSFGFGMAATGATYRSFRMIERCARRYWTVSPSPHLKSTPILDMIPKKPNKARHPTGWADVSHLPFSNSNLYSTFNAPPRPSGGCA